MSAATCSTDIGRPPGFIPALDRAGVVNQLLHAREILFADIALGQNLSHDLAWIATEQIVDDAGDRLAPHRQLTDARPVNEHAPVGAMTDDAPFFQPHQQCADGSDGQLARALEGLLHLRCRRLSLIPQDTHDRQLEIAQIGYHLNDKLQLSLTGRQASALLTAFAAALPLPIAPFTVPFLPSASAASPANQRVPSIPRANCAGALAPPTSG